MADLPAPFAGPMVRALLREIENPGTGKTQTRRGNHLKRLRTFGDITEFGRSDTPGYDWHFRDSGMRWHDLRHSELLDVLPYRLGDRLYVREHWRVSKKWDGHSPAKSHNDKPVLPPRQMTVLFEAGGSIANQKSGRWEPSSFEPEPSQAGWVGKHRQAMHMPKWASRITLVVTDVRVERLQDISEADAIAEGAPLNPNHRDGTEDGSNPYMVRLNAWTSISPVAWYHRLWNDINGPGAWEENPWVAAYTFRPILGNIDQIARDVA